VCEDPQVDATHLADHLAITASLRGGEHEAWLDEHAPDWGDRDAETLGPIVAEHAEPVDLDLADADETQPRHDTPGRPDQGAARPDHGRRTQSDRLSDRDRAILEEAREMTRRMLAEEDEAQGEDEGEDEG
jgi:hypothetical protein